MMQGMNKFVDDASSTWTAPTVDTSSIVCPAATAAATSNIISHPKHNHMIVVLETAGGTDKDESGHRRDTLPIVKGIVDAGCDSLVLQIQEESCSIMRSEEQASAARLHNNWVKNFILTNRVAGVVVRNNPGTLSATTQAKMDTMLVSLHEQGIRVMSHPQVQQRMGAKDALCKIRHLRCGLVDTDVYYSLETFATGFRKSIAFRPRVIKQNRGSQGEGIWICKLKNEDYCENFGDRVADLDAILVLMEANDNHVEEHTVAEFIEFCLHGRTLAAGTWTSEGQGQYLQGGIDLGAMLVDQRFLPRIVEGEVRVLMVGSTIVELIHKVPKQGGLSATLQSGAVYTKYTPDDATFAKLVANFKQDLPDIMQSFGLEDQPLPLLWTADYIFGDEDADGRDNFYVGEFNCSCVGITQQLELATLVGKTAVNTCFPQLGVTDTDEEEVKTEQQATSLEHVTDMPPLNVLAMVKVVGIDFCE